MEHTLQDVFPNWASKEQILPSLQSASSPKGLVKIHRRQARKQGTAAVSPHGGNAFPDLLQLSGAGGPRQVRLDWRPCKAIIVLKDILLWKAGKCLQPQALTLYSV